MARKLPRKFYQQDTISLAKALLGKRLVFVTRGKRRSGIIVETEAYLGAEDPACHTWKNRKSGKNKSMYLTGGHSYIYLIYGMHYCFNVVSRTEKEPEAVLIRAIEPEENITLRTDGPGRLCKAMGLKRNHDGLDLLGKTIFIENIGRVLPESEIGASPRIGVDYAGDAAKWPLRFYWKGSGYLSRREKN